MGKHGFNRERGEKGVGNELGKRKREGERLKDSPMH